MPRRAKVWRPRVKWARRPTTQVVRDGREPSRQEIRRQAREAARQADEEERTER